MKFLKKRRGEFYRELGDNDPLSGIANLFDLSVVFIVGLIITLFSAYHLMELFDQKSSLTIVKKSQTGEMEIISKEGKKIKAMRVTKSQMQGRGERLGTAYRLQDGSMVYVPD